MKEDIQLAEEPDNQISDEPTTLNQILVDDDAGNIAKPHFTPLTMLDDLKYRHSNVNNFKPQSNLTRKTIETLNSRQWVTQMVKTPKKIENRNYSQEKEGAQEMVIPLGVKAP